MNILAFVTANYVARQVGYDMSTGWGRADEATQAHFRPIETFEARLIVNAERKVSINSFDFELRGQERAHGAPITHSLRTLCALKEIVTDFRAVPPGRTVVGLAFDLPHDLPPSYQGRLFQVDYQLSARADIP